MTGIHDDVREGLWQDPPSLPARWFYDERGSRLFDEITRLPEYYPTRRETEILEGHSADIVRQRRKERFNAGDRFVVERITLLWSCQFQNGDVALSFGDERTRKFHVERRHHSTS